MRTISLLLLVALTESALAVSHVGYSRRARRELLLRSKRRWVLTTIEVEEEAPGPYPKEISKLFNEKGNNETQHHKYQLSGKGVDLPPLRVFSVHEQSGAIYINRAIDRETDPFFHITFDILDKKNNKKLDNELSFDVKIQDINDNAPTFFEAQMTANVQENTPEGYLPVELRFKDRDEKNNFNSKINISVISQNPKQPKIGVYQINQEMAQLKLEGCFDYDKIKKYRVIVQAKDHGTPSLSSTAVVTLNIVDTNTHPPRFKERKYYSEVLESTTHYDVLRVAVEDKDTPNTPGWRAKYFFIKGNEEKNYKLETDPSTNEGILSVIKGNDFERTPLTILQIGVKNEEPLFVCKHKSSGGSSTRPPPDSVNITIKVIDANDPPEFEKRPFDLHQMEEQKPGKVFFIPKAHDVDSDNIRYVLLEDPADWLSIDEETGNITLTGKMDRESPFVDDNIYKVVIGAIDDGEPPATGTCTVQIYLGDINDNKPRLVNKGVTMCGNKVNKVMVSAEDLDMHPYSGPFRFSLGGDDRTLEQKWKLNPDTGEKGGLVSLNPLPYGNYSVPLVIQDQQNMIGHDTVEVMVCDCGEGDVCLGRRPFSASLGGASIGLIFAGLLLFLLLLCACITEGKEVIMMQEENDQTLIKYNQEGRGSDCKIKPSLRQSTANSVGVRNSLKQDTMKINSNMTSLGTRDTCRSNGGQTMINSNMTSLGTRDTRRSNGGQTMINSNMTSLGTRDTRRSNGGQTMINSNMTSLGTRDTRRSNGGQTMINSNMTSLGTRDTRRSNGGQTMWSTWTTNRSNAFQGGSSKSKRSFSLRSNQYMAALIERSQQMIEGNPVHHPVYIPHQYAYEGEGSTCQSLDSLSLSNLGDDLKFLNDLGPRFKTLGSICHQTIQEKKMQL